MLLASPTDAREASQHPWGWRQRSCCASNEHTAMLQGLPVHTQTRQLPHTTHLPRQTSCSLGSRYSQLRHPGSKDPPGLNLNFSRHHHGPLEMFDGDFCCQST